ncbi:MAG: MarR family transcriptional regulator [Oligoflexia bacterium]|nr:MarR family transcriptional regulator [Oligoflexia bacterium]
MLGTAQESTFDNTWHRLSDLFLRFNRRLSFILFKLKPPLTTNESHLLVELYHGKGGISRDLASLLMVQKGAISRLVSALRGRGLLSVDSSQEDRRLKLLGVTTAGIQLLERDLDLRNLEIAECLGPLQQEERDRLLIYLRSIAEELESPQMHAREQDDPLLIQIRRLTRSLGFIGENYLATGLPSDHCQILHNLLVRQGEMPFQELATKLPYSYSDLSRLVSALEAVGLLRKLPYPGDRRRFRITLTETGKRRAQINLEQQAARLRRAVRGFSSEELADLLQILEKFIFAPNETIFTPTNLAWAFKVISDSRELREARAFLLDGLVRNKLHLYASEYLLARKHLCLGLARRDALSGVIEISNEDPAKPTVVNLMVAGDLRSSSAPTRLLVYALTLLNQFNSFESLAIPAPLFFSWIEPDARHAAEYGMVHLGKADVERLVRAVL